MTAEQKFHSRIRETFDGDLVRIENVAGAGLPDLNWCIDGVEVWIELKIYTRKRVLLRKLQYAWSIRRSRYGGRVYIIAYDEERDMYDLWRFPMVHPVFEDPYVRVINPPEWSCTSMKSLLAYMKAQTIL